MANPLGELLAPPLPEIAAQNMSKKKKKGSRVMVKGCAKEAKFTLHYGDPAKLVGKGKKQRMTKDAACNEFEMNAKLHEFLNENLNACLDRAGDGAFGYGTLTNDLRSGGNKIFHDGCIGDANHQSTGSWHNEGLAFDVTAFKIGARVIRYEDALNTKSEEGRRADSFFTHFRRCWAEKVSGYDDSCKTRGKERTGSMGNEDHRHHHHLHLSLPCRNVSSGRASFVVKVDYEN